MKKSFITLLLVLSLYSLSAQNWQLVNSNTQQWYKSKNGTLKVIVLDSVKILNQDTIFYFPVTLGFKTRNPTQVKVPANTSNPWWTGSKMILKQDATQLFFNVENDTLTFQPNKALNDSWQLVKFPSGNYINATVKSLSTDSIFGTIDSIKTIQLGVYSKNNLLLTSHLINNQEIKISKNHGLVKLIPFFSIVDSPGVWYYELPSNKFAIDSFILCSAGKRLRVRDIYNFNTGDVFQHLKQECNIYIKTTILAKTDFGDSIKYKIESSYEQLCNGYKLDSIVQKDWWIYQANNLFSNLYPDQYSKEYSSFMEYKYEINSCGLVSLKKESKNFGLINDTLYYRVSFELPFITRGYAENLGMIDSTLTTIDGRVDYHFSLFYSKSNYCKIGSSAYGINTQKSTEGITLYPNPAQTILKLNSTIPITEFKIYNSLGAIVLASINQEEAQEVNIDVAALKQGIYFVQINECIPLKFAKVN